MAQRLSGDPTEDLAMWLQSKSFFDGSLVYQHSMLAAITAGGGYTLPSGMALRIGT